MAVNMGRRVVLTLPLNSYIQNFVRIRGDFQVVRRGKEFLSKQQALQNGLCRREAMRGHRVMEKYATTKYWIDWLRKVCSLLPEAYVQK